MGQSRLQNSIRNVIFGFLNKIIMIIFPFFIRTIMIHKLGSEYLGLNGLFTSVLQMLSLSELGFGSAMVYSMYKPISEDDSKTLCGLLNLYKKFYYIVGSIIVIVGIILLPFIPKLINGTYPSDINIYILYLIYLINTALSYFLFAYKSAILIAYQRNDIESNISTIVNIGMYLIQIIVLIMFSNYYIYILFMPISTIIINYIRSYAVDRLYPNIECKGKVSPDLIKDIKMRVTSLIGHQLSGTINCSFDNIVVSAFLGLNILGIYSNYYYIVSSLSSVLLICFNSISASIGNSIVRESKIKNYEDFLQVFFINNWVVGWCSICMICLYQSFIKLWVGEEYLLPMFTVILFVVYFYSWQIRRTVLTYKNACGMWWADKYKPYVSMIFNLILNITLVQIIGLNGVLLSTIFVYLFVEAPWETIILHKKYFNMSIKKYIFRLCVYSFSTLIILIITFIVCSFIKDESILGFLMKCVICVILPNIIMTILMYKTNEFKKIKSKISSLLKKG